MNENEIKWMPYPENKPPESGEYLVTRQGNFGSGNNIYYVTITNFDPYFKQYDKNDIKFFGPAWPDDQLGGTFDDVIAWAEKPKPFSF